MTIALEIFDALEEMTADLERGTEFTLNHEECQDLLKLTEADLQSRHLGKQQIEKVLFGLWNKNLEPLAATLGVKLNLSEEAPRLTKKK